MPSVPPKPLTDKQQRFVDEYLIDLNATQAAIRAGYSAKTAEQQGPRLLGYAGVRDAIAAGKAARSERTGITADDVVERFRLIATADPRELIEYRRGACRYCHGQNHDYQRTRGELAKARAVWEASQKKNSTETFDEQGGDGYNATKPPHPDCPECFGEGLERVYVHDTRRLSPAALALYAGVKVTKDGIEVKMHDQAAALVNLGKHLGLFDEKQPPADDEAEKINRIRKALRVMDELTAP